MTGKEAELIFKKHALKRGFKHKVVGDFAFQRKANAPQSAIIRLIEAKKDCLLVYEEGIGRYFVASS